MQPDSFEPHAPVTRVPARTGIGALVASFLLPAAALLLAMAAHFYLIDQYGNSMYDWDFREWATYNGEIVRWALLLLGGACLLEVIAAIVFLTCLRRARWLMRAAFAVQWLGVVALLAWIAYSLRPH
jgi:hypothetical protein